MSRRGNGDASTDGARAEEAAARWLEQQGMRLVARNYRCKVGELDVVGLHSGTLVFVEVRLRGRGSLAGAAESVTLAKQRRLTLAATHFLTTHPRWQRHPCRFDVMAGREATDGFGWEWLQHAFDACT
jgi:putative endonuclease